MNVHEHVKNQRRDILHKVSLRLVQTHSNSASEKSGIPGMLKNPYPAKSILDAGWGCLIRFTRYKSVMLRGRGIVRVDSAYPAQDYSRCGYRVPKTLAERIHLFPDAG